jgi:O-antigen/teichoic acid export membrane protein
VPIARRGLRRLTRDLAATGTSSSLRVALSGFFLRSVQALTSFVNVILLARALGPAGRGEYFLFLASLAVLTRLVDLGMSPAAVVYAGRYPQARARIHSVLLRLTLAVWVTAAALVGMAVWLGGSTVAWPPHRVALGLVILPLLIYEQIWTHLMVGMRRVLAMNLVQTGGGMLSLALVTVLVVGQSGGLTAAIVITGLVAAAKALMMLSIAWRTTRQDATADTNEIRTWDMVTFGLRSYPNSLALLLWTRLPGFVLAAVQGPTALGVFSVAQQTVEQMLLPAQSTQDAIYQRVTWLPRERATAAMNQCLRLFVPGMLLLGSMAAILAPWAFGFLFGDAFAGSSVIFQILLISTTVTVVPALLSPYFFGQLQRPELVSIVAWTRVGIALWLSMVFAREFGGVGVALALVIADVSSMLLMLGLYVKMAGTPLRRAVVPCAADVELVFGQARALLSWRTLQGVGAVARKPVTLPTTYPTV